MAGYTEMRLGKNTIVDSSTEGNDGTQTGTLHVVGPFDRALDFYPKAKSWIHIPHDASLNFGTDDWTINLWLQKKLSESTNETLLAKLGVAHYPGPVYDDDGYGLQFFPNAFLFLRTNYDIDPILRVNLLQYDPSLIVHETVERFPNVNLLLDWSFDTGADDITGSVFDASGYFHFGYFEGGAEATLDYPYVFSWVPYSLLLDGVDSYVTCDASLNAADGGTLTVAVWVKGTGEIYSAKAHYSGTYTRAYQDAHFTFRTENTDASADDWEPAFPGEYDTATWNFLIFEQEQIGANYVKRIYANNVLVDSKTVNNKTLAQWDAPFLVGKLYDIAGYFTGRIDEVKIYSKILSTAEKTRLFIYNASDWKGNVVGEPSEFKTGSTYIGWYRGGFPGSYIGYNTSNDGKNWTDNPSNPISFAPTIPDGATIFPSVIYEAGHYYMFIRNQVDEKIYLFNMDNPTAPAPLNGGLPVLEGSQSWEAVGILNVHVVVINGVWHMIYETATAYPEYRIGYTYSTLSEMNWNTHKSENPIFAAGCPSMIYVPERNAILVVHGEGEQYGSLAASYAYLTDDLSLSTSWHHGKVLLPPDESNLVIGKSGGGDPSMIVGFSDTYPLEVSYNYFQTTIREFYSAKTLTEFFDSILVNDKDWHMLTFTNDGGILKFYLDSALITTGTWSRDVTSTKPLCFGKISFYDTVGYTGDPMAGWFTGVLADVRVYNGRAITQSEIDDLFVNIDIDDTDLVLHLLFEEEPIYEDDDPDAQDYSKFWLELLSAQKKTFGNNTTKVTRYALRLHGRDPTTGQMAREYEDMSKIDMIIINKNSARTSYTAGYFVRLDALGVTGDVIREGDKMELSDGTVYRVASVQPQRAGNIILLWTCDLEELPFKEI